MRKTPSVSSRKNRDVIRLLVLQFNGEWLREMGDSSLSSFGNCGIPCA
ncbi:hypothetical protein LLG96_20125 [bacterium]|nr:hypothetical protein [bacterium]